MYSLSYNSSKIALVMKYVRELCIRPGQSTEFEYPSKVKVFSEKSTWVQVKVLSSKKYSGKSKSIFKKEKVVRGLN